jgi:hypothetical protein
MDYSLGKQAMGKEWACQGQKGLHGSGVGVLGKVIPNPKLKLLDQVREVMRIKQLIRLAPAHLTPLGL